eukprot:Nitzschia sp. Nitz4//scaffold94_size78252//23658//23975//NITZ4_005464-RA/size78252-processed-gene-0.21-mRNA-1//-1//CDS//3329560368//2339//frame0
MNTMSRAILSSSVIRRCYSSSPVAPLPMKAGTVLKALGVHKDKEPPVVLERSDYPSWVSDLATPLPSLAVLRRIPNEDAQDEEIMRYLKLSRRLHIKGQNEQSAN